MMNPKFNLLKLVARMFLAFQIISLMILLTLPLPAAAQSSADAPTILNFTPQVQIPNSKFKGAVPVGTYNAASGTMTSDLLSKYIIAIYNYGLAIAGILATIVLMGGGVLWLVSGGESGKINQAKELITGSITGAIILVAAWMILNTVNPNLVNLKSIETVVIKRVAYCCDPINGNVIMNKEGKCSTASAVKCVEGQICKNTGNNKFLCVSDQGSYCCEYKANSGIKMVSCATIPFDNKTKCPTPPSGFYYATSYSNLYCGNKTMMATDCKGGNCVGKDAGDNCDGVSGAYCYNEICYTGVGPEGQPCGNETNSKCDKDLEQGGKNCVGDLGGRSCGDGLWCCKFKSDGTRINKT